MKKLDKKIFLLLFLVAALVATYNFLSLRDIFGSKTLSIAVIYGFILTAGFVLHGGAEDSKQDDISDGREGGNINLSKGVIFLLIFSAIYLITWKVLGPLLISDNNFMREFGFFLNVTDNIEMHLLPNISYYYPYGLAPIYLGYLLKSILGRPIIALVSLKVVLDLLAAFLGYYLLKVLGRWRTSDKWLYLFMLAGLQVIFFAPGSLHATPLRYLILLLPLIAAIKYLDKKSSLVLTWLVLSPVACYMVSPETGLVSVAFLVILSFTFYFGGVLNDEFIRDKKNYLPLLFILLVVIVSSTIAKEVIANSFQYARSITAGLVKTELPPVFPIIGQMMAGRNLNNLVLLVENLMFYLFLFPLSVLLAYSLRFLKSVYKNKEIAINGLAVASLCFFALAYLLKSLGGFVSLSYQSLTLFFVLIAFLLLKPGGWEVKCSKYILIAYVSILLIPWAYFYYIYTLKNKDSYHNYYDQRSAANIGFTQGYLSEVEGLKELTGGLLDSDKVFLLTDNAPGLYYLIDRPNYTRYLNPGFVYSDETRNELLADVDKNKFDYIVISKKPEDFINPKFSELLLIMVDNYMKNKYKLDGENDNYKIYKKI